MAKRVKYDGRVFEVVERATFGEAAALERQAKIKLSEMVDSEESALLMLISLRRAGVMLTWADIMQASPNDFEYVDDEVAEADASEGEGEVPPTAGAEAGSVETGTSGDGAAA